MGAGIEAMHGLQQHGLTKLTWLQLCWVSNLNNRDQSWVPVSHHSQENISQLPRGMLITLDQFHHRRGSILLLMEQTQLGMNWPSLHTMHLPKLPSMDLQNALSIMLLQTALLLIKELASYQWSAAVAYAHEIHWSFHVLYHPEAAGLIEQWNDFLKTLSQYQVISTLQDWDKFLREPVYALN